MKIIKKFFGNSVIFVKYTAHKDTRGEFAEIYNKKKLIEIGIKKSFVQDNQSISKRQNTFRGIHFQLNPFSQAKLIRVIRGSIIDFVVDLRKNSKTFGKNIKIKLGENDNQFLFIPEGFGHAFLTLKNNTIINYKVSNYYSSKHSKSIIFNDKTIRLNIHKKILNKIHISDNDKMGITLNEFKEKYLGKL